MPAKLSSGKTQAALRTSARVSLQMLVVLLMTYVVLRVLGLMWSVIWPLVVALLLTTLTWPVARFLRRRGWHPALAASVVTVLFLGLAAGIVVLIAVPVASQSGQLVTFGRTTAPCSRGSPRPGRQTDRADGWGTGPNDRS